MQAKLSREPREPRAPQTKNLRCTATILAIDPGPNTSAYVLAESESASYPALSFRILLSEILRTEQLLQDLPKLSRSRSQCVIEGLSPTAKSSARICSTQQL